MSSPRSHQKVAVVTINDLTLKRFDADLPLSYQRQVFVLRQILEADPAAIYVDFRMAYEHTDESLTQFQSILDEAKSKHIPIFFARGEEGHDQIDLPAPLTGVESYSNALETSSAYPLMFEEEGGEKTEKSQANAAFDVYRSLCTSTWSGQCGVFREDDFHSPMIIQWGLHVDPDQTQVTSLDNSPRNTCAVPFTGGILCRSIVQSFTLGFRAFWGSSRDYEVGHAYYPLTIGAQQLNERGRGTPPGSPPLSHLLKGRAVFYGTDIRDQHDDTVIPFLGRVPNVVLHAMAFDNLVTYGSRYFQEPPEHELGRGFSFGTAEVCELALWLIFTGWMAFKFYYSHPQIPAGHGTRLQRGLLRKSRDFLSLPLFVSAIIPACFCVALAVFDLSHLPSLRNGIDETLLYVCLFLLLLGTLSLLRLSARRAEAEETAPEDDESEAEKAEKLRLGFWAHLALLTSLTGIVFALNELFLHWPNADWVGFILLWLAVGESCESTGFVLTFVNFFSRRSQDHTRKHTPNPESLSQ
ncbi:CHASE2 domain-containing protein [Gluconobacter kanchanaburiensis]|nr:CHASE2 domain-containing protein [Gluconobacter kanchanaburiensis]MBF0861951.1 CHASE2 domain-containing protein [Gluconobacter kanchanaburiensis]